VPPDAAVASGQQGTRVRAVLTPRAAASAPAAGGKPAAPAATPAPGAGLRSTTTLGGEARP
jgi:lipopolysaccharide export system protein LptA